MGVLLVLFLILLAFLFGALGIYMALYKKRVEFTQRLDARVKDLLRSKVAEQDKQVRILREEALKEPSVLDQLVHQSKWGKKLSALIEQADVNINLNQLLLICLGLFVAVGVISWLVRDSLTVALLLGGLFGGVPIGYVYFVRSQRMDQFLEQLPDALDLITRALRAGYDFNSALKTAATEMPDPIAKEFRKTYEELNLGTGVRASLEHLAERVPIIDLRLCVTAILINREVGGNLAEILANVATVIRERFKILGQVKVYTAQGTLTGWVIGLLPVALGLYMYIVNPDYVKLLFTDPLGQMMLWAGVVLETAGILIIRKVVNIKV